MQSRYVSPQKEKNNKRLIREFFLFFSNYRTEILLLGFLRHRVIS
jgi:hypothetical protein